MKAKKLIALLLAVVLCAMVFAACNKTPDPTPDPVDPGPTDPTPGVEPPPSETVPQDLMVCVGPDPETIDPARNSSVDGSIILTNAFSGLYGFKTNEAGEIVLVADCAEEVVTPVEIEDGKYQYVIKIKDGLKWSDGVDLKASDFVYSWNRACDPATAADYQYIFDVIDGYDEVAPELNITADDAAGTVTVVTSTYCIYFDQLLAFPTYFPVRQDIVEADPEGWATNVATYVSNGAFTMTGWDVGSKITFAKNEHYWDADSVTLDTITYALSSDDDANYVNFQNATYMLITNVPVSLIPELKTTRLNQDFFIGDYIGTYFIQFNVEKSFKPGNSVNDNFSSWGAEENADVRHALGLMIDREYIVNEVTQGGQIPAYGFVPQGMDDGTGTEFRSKAEPWWDPSTHDANVDEAVEILKKYFTYDEASGKFTDFPTFEFSVNPTTGNLAMAAAIQDMWSDYGIECTVDQREWSVIQTALTQGDFTMSRLGWIADYNDPVNFLEIYVGVSGNNHPRLGKDGPIGSSAVYGTTKSDTWSNVYDALITKIKTESDLAARAEYMYEAEAILRDTYAVIPIYYYTNPYMANESLINYIYSPLGWISFKYAYLAD